MSLRLEEIKNRVAKVFPDVIPVDEDVLRFYKHGPNDTPFAVYYLDVAQALPRTPAELRKYVERIIGTGYFEGKSSLQWNNYLYFIRDSQELQRAEVDAAKKLIEDNREYARKFVIGEQDIDAFLKPSIVEPDIATKRVDAISLWIKALDQPHLIEAVFGKYKREDRRKIADGTKPLPSLPSLPSTTSTPGHQEITQLPRLRNFKIEAFRACLLGRVFDFHDVNLLFGVNGAGKTSALEAIELYYCGKHTKRNPDTAENYRFFVSVEGSQSESVTQARAAGIFRDRNRDWYGVREQRKSHLYDSFGRFNFLDTDAAVDLAKSDEDSVNAHLARLVVGSDAAMIWPVIEQLAYDVATELAYANKDRTESSENLQQLQKQIQDSTTIKTESDSLRAALREALKQNQWSTNDYKLESEVGELIEQLSAFLGLARQAVEFTWIDAPVTLDKCLRFANAVHEFVDTHTLSVQKLESLTARQKALEAATIRTQQAATLAAELGRLIEAGVERRASELDTQRGLVASASSVLAGIDGETLATVAKTATNRSVTLSHAAAMELRKSAEAAANDARRDSEQFGNVRHRSVLLAQQLRQLAGQIITEESRDECPLCHTKFKPGELERHMAIGLDEHMEAAAQKLLANVSRLDDEYRRAAAMETALASIVRYCHDARFSADATITDALTKISETQTTLASARERIENLNSEIRLLQTQGFSLERLNAVRTQLNALGFSGAYQSSEEAVALQGLIQENSRSASEEMKSTAESIANFQAILGAALQVWRTKAADPRDALAVLEERRVTTQEIHFHLVRFCSLFPWQDTRPIGEWIVQGESVRGVAAKLLTALGTERVTANMLTETERRRDKLQELVKELDSRIGLLSGAHSVLQMILNNYSLEALTQFAMQDNLKHIEMIFSQIHSPAEFASIVVDDNRWALKRKVGEELVKLTQISTGQRAAFALSVFLAQNAQLMAGPPAILIDDPIAHLDDLNSLSFLDYLREIALAGRRQIFFATANEKLASLFERKFDFMGERFRRFNL